MTPAARLAEAAALLDRISAGDPAEKVLTNWGRAARYAGSGDRAAVRDIVYDILRTQRSCAALGGGLGGRSLAIGYVRGRGEDVSDWFTGARHALPALSDGELQAGAPPEGWAALDLPDWIGPLLAESLGSDLEPVANELRKRAPVFLRVHAGHGSREEAMARLAEEGISAVPHPLAETALRIETGARRVRTSQAFAEGLVEVQDAASQAVCAALPAGPGVSVLDYCAGGGGKALALAARGAAVTAHDANPGRMRDLSPRVERAGDEIAIVTPQRVDEAGWFDTVLVDVPCSGSGAWRRQVEAKWQLTETRLAELIALQAQILSRAAKHVKPGGALAYVTCSLLDEENEGQIMRFLADGPGQFRLERQRRWSPLEGGDGFFLALLRDRRHDDTR